MRDGRSTIVVKMVMSLSAELRPITKWSIWRLQFGKKRREDARDELSTSRLDGTFCKQNLKNFFPLVNVSKHFFLCQRWVHILFMFQSESTG